MWWIMQSITSFFYYSILDFVFFIIVDAFAKFTIGDTNSKTIPEKRLIWLWESVVLFILSFIIYLCDHVPYLLITLSVVTFGYTQFGVSFNFYRWWRQMKTRWEEHQHHQDSMTRLQVQLAMHQQQQQQQEALQQMMAFNHQSQHAVQQPGQQNIFNATPANKPRTGQEERGIYKSIWSKTPKIQLSSLFKRSQTESNEEKAANPNSSPPPPMKKQEFSFMPSLRAKSSFAGGQHFATTKDDSPPAKPSWYGDNLSRKPLRSARLMPYSPASRPENDSLRTRIMSKFGFGSSESTPPGLRNEGQNLCFINAVIQCLGRTPGLVSELENEAAYKDSDCSMAESLLLSTLSELMHSCNMNGKPLLDPIAFRQAASSLNPNLVAPPTQRQSQQDAAEFFMWLVESLHSIINRNRKTRSNDKPAPRESKRLKVMKFIYGDLTPAKVADLKKACKQEINAAHGLLNDSYAESVQRLSDLEWITYKEENSSVVDNLLTGQLVIAYHCLADNHISVNMQTFSILPVPIEAPRQVNGLVHLSDCFTKFCNIEHLVGQDGLECSFCNAQRARQLEQVRTPVNAPYLRNNFNFRTPNGRTTALSSADSAVSGVGSPLATNFMSPIPGSRDILSDSGFQDNVFKTSTPISDNQIPLPQRLRDAQRRCSLRQLPDCLVIQLMRFSFNPYTRQTNKVHAPISIPLSNLDLTDVMFDTITNREDLAEEEAIYKYDLYGLCCHLGGDSANYGHYVSYCLHSDNKWYRFDDERVIEVDMEYELTTHEIRQNAYLLFYKKQGMSV